MKTMKINNKKSLFGRVHLPAGKAILLAGACLSLEGVSAMGATLSPQPVAPAPMHPDIAASRNVPHTRTIGDGNAGLNSGFNFTAINYAKGWTSWTGDYSQKYSKAAVEANTTATLFGLSVPGAAFNATVENNNGSKRSSYWFKVGSYTVTSGWTSGSFELRSCYPVNLVTVQYPIFVGPCKVNLSASLGATADVAIPLMQASSSVGLSGMGGAGFAGTIEASLQAFPIDIPQPKVGVQAVLTLGRSQIMPEVTVHPSSASGEVDLAFSPAQFELNAFVKAAMPWPIPDLYFTYELLGWTAESSYFPLTQF
jgi:hypothetical protein